MRDLAEALGNLPLPGFAGKFETHAPRPVWRDSTTAEVTWRPIPMKKVWELQRCARLFDQQTAAKGQHGGKLKHVGIRIWDALTGFIEARTGRLEPSIAAIARKANACPRAVAKYLKIFRELGMLQWVRRCAAGMRDGRHVLEQKTNAYFLQPVTEWLGFRPPMGPPPPAPGTWGDHPRMPSLLDEAVMERTITGSEQTAIAVLETAPPSSLEAALARLGRAVQAKNPG